MVPLPQRRGRVLPRGQRLRQRQPGLPAVFMSAHVAPASIADEDGPLLAKPFDDDTLHAALAERLG